VFRLFLPEEIREKGRLKAGKMLLVDTEAGKIFYDKELKAQNWLQNILTDNGSSRTWSNSKRLRPSPGNNRYGR
jgi:glutamate synthase (NADPH/NADH) large chain